MGDLHIFKDGELLIAGNVNNNFTELNNRISECQEKLTAEKIAELLTENENDNNLSGLASTSSVVQINNKLKDIYNYIDTETTRTTVNDATAEELAEIEVGETSATIRDDEVITYRNNITTTTKTVVVVNSVTNKTTTTITTTTREESGRLYDIRENVMYNTFKIKKGRIVTEQSDIDNFSSNYDTDKYYIQDYTNDYTYTQNIGGANDISVKHYRTHITSATGTIPIENNNFYWIKKTYLNLDKTKLVEIECGGEIDCTFARKNSGNWFFKIGLPNDTDIERLLNDNDYIFDFSVSDDETISANGYVGSLLLKYPGYGAYGSNCIRVTDGKNATYRGKITWNAKIINSEV